MSFPVTTLQFATSKPGVTVPTWQDISPYLISFDTQRGRQYETDQIGPGTMSVTLDNSDRRFDPTYTAGPYYPNVLPRKRLRLSTVWNSVTYYLFDGYVERWPPAWAGPDVSTVTVNATDSFLPLATANISGNFPQELSGARISRVLAAAQWPSSSPVSGYWTLGTSQLGVNNVLGYGIPTSLLDAGTWQIQASTIADADDVSALDHIRAVTDTEAGSFFADGQGRLVFHDRFHRIKTPTAAATFTDNPAVADASHVVYFGLSPSFDYDRGANDVKVTADGLATQTATDGAAIDDYFRATLSLSTLHASSVDALSAAYFRLNEVADIRDFQGRPRLRVDSVSIHPWAPVGAEAWPAVLGREISDRINVRRQPGVHPAGLVEEINQDCFVEAIRHSSTGPNNWVTVFELSPASPAADFWLLGTSALNQTTVLA
jgi:hypothetical protein